MNAQRRALMQARFISTGAASDGRSTTVLSWNLMHGAGAGTEDIVRLVRIFAPDIVLMQEATGDIDALPDLIGGDYAREPLPGRRHGVACWSATSFTVPPFALALPSGAIVHRVCQIVGLDGFALANVHLSHGQMLNRRQLRVIAAALPQQAAVLGDFNLVGPVLLPQFRDVGPRAPTHRMVDVLPLRIDRCLVRGLRCEEAYRLPRIRSDHHPILVRLKVMGPDGSAARHSGAKLSAAASEAR